MIFPDESGFSVVSPLKRTWAPRGQTPTIYTSIKRSDRLNLIGALGVTPQGRKVKLHLRTYRRTLTGDQVIAFLTLGLRRIRGPIVMLWDKHPIHQRRKVQDFLARHPRIYVYDFPTAAPELNPTEFVWNQISEYNASSAPHDRIELQTNVSAGIARTRNSQKRLWACIFASDLPWKR